MPAHAGVATLLQHSLLPYTVAKPTPPHLRGYLCWVHLDTTTPFGLVNVYIPPGNSSTDAQLRQDVYQELSTIIDNYEADNTPLLLGGDFNATHLLEGRPSRRLQSCDRAHKAFVADAGLTVLPIDGSCSASTHTSGSSIDAFLSTVPAIGSVHRVRDGTKSDHIPLLMATNPDLLQLPAVYQPPVPCTTPRLVTPLKPTQIAKYKHLCEARLGHKALALQLEMQNVIASIRRQQTHPDQALIDSYAKSVQDILEQAVGAAASESFTYSTLKPKRSYLPRKLATARRRLP